MMTVEEFCERYRIHRATFYRLRKAGKGPRVTKIGKCTRISEEAAAEWFASCEEST